MQAQSGERQRSGKRRLREGKRTAANRRSALRKCRNAVSAGVLSPISSAVGRNGAAGDKESARAGARNSPLRRGRGTRDTSSAPLRGHLSPCGSVRGFDTPPACHSIPRTIKGEGLGDKKKRPGALLLALFIAFWRCRSGRSGTGETEHRRGLRRGRRSWENPWHRRP